MRVLLLVALVVVLASQVSADTLDTSRGMPLREISHTVDVRVEDGVAIYVVRRQFKNPGKLADEVRLSIDLPAGAVATGLRIRAKDRWHDGELLEANLAARRYEELTGAGVHNPKDPALLFWISSQQLYLQMFPVFPGTVSTVEYTLKAPTRYAGGRHVVTYPRVSPTLARPVITVRTARPIVVDGQRIAGTRVTLSATRPSAAPDDEGDDPQDDDDDDEDDDGANDPEDAQLAEIGIDPPAIVTWSARLARVVASDAHAFTRLELDTAPQLSRVPRRAQIVFVIDASFSAAELLAPQLAVIQHYARHVPDAELEIVATRRTASRVFGTFVPARELAGALARAKQRGAFAPGNGSALERGARLAAELVGKRRGPQRVVLLTDEQLRSSLTDEATLAAIAGLDPQAVVHVVVPLPAPTRARLARDDQAALAPLATRHHGIYATLSGELTGPALGRAVLELVRPVRIDQLAATGSVSIADTLAEGAGIRLFEGRTKAEAPGQITLTGKLWSDPIKLELSPSTAFNAVTAGFVFGADLHTALDAREQMALALAARAVSPVTSYLAIEPGVRPSKIGLDRDGGGIGWGTIGSGRYGTIGFGGSPPPSPTAQDLQALIDTRACIARHVPAAGWSVKLAIETTRDEIVDVTVSTGAGPLADCLAETAWAVRLPAKFAEARAAFVVDLLSDRS